ncbi:MAG: PHB depolymerase family esterase [Myxococcota bacterium]
MIRICQLFANTRAVATLCAIFVFAPEIALADLTPGLHEVSLVSGGRNRTYDVYVPASYSASTPAPLVLDFHGFTSSNGLQRLISGWQQKADEEGFVVAWPQGVGVVPGWNAETCCGEALLGNVDDVGFARDVVEDIQQQASIDPDRIYATGLSNGGAITHSLGCRAADLFAAIAPVSFPLPFLSERSCRPSRQMPIIQFHGFQDTIVPYWTGIAPTFRSAPQSRNDWADINDCRDRPSITLFQLGSSCRTHDRCDGTSEVTLCSLQSGHSAYINASFISIPDIAWDFFERHTMP